MPSENMQASQSSSRSSSQSSSQTSQKLHVTRSVTKSTDSQSTAPESNCVENQYESCTEGGDDKADDYKTNFEQRMDKMLEVKLDDVISRIGKKVEHKLDQTLDELSQKIELKMLEKIGEIDKKVDDRLNKFETRLDCFAANITQCMEGMSTSSQSTESLETKINSLESTVKTLKTQLEEQKQITQASMKQAAEKIENLEVYSRKLNLVFEGIPHVEGENCHHIIESLVRREMNVRISDFIDVAHRQYVPKRGDQPEKPIPIIVRCKTLADKNRILDNSRQLANTGKSVHNHLPISVIERRSYLYSQCQAAKSVDAQATIVRNKLRFQGKLHSVDELQNLNIGVVDSTTETDSQIRFYGKNSCFSNFYRSPFVMRGIRFSCVEQAFQYGRACMANDYYTANQILSEPNPVVMKRLGKRFKAQSDDVLDKERAIMAEAVELKFRADDSLNAKLLATHPKRILECNPYDKYYSTGLQSNNDQLDQLNFPGKNHLGLILESVRDKLKK